LTALPQLRRREGGREGEGKFIEGGREGKKEKEID
jgi:hypothetical protein